METANFKRNVLRTISVRAAKAGVRNALRSQVATNTMHGIFGLNTEVGALMDGLNPYLLGFQLNDELLQTTFTAMGGVCYYTVLLAKVLKVKIPGSGKKVHLDGTKTEGLLELQSTAQGMLYGIMSVFHGENMNLEDVAKDVKSIIDLIWPLTYDLLGVTPAEVFADYSSRLAAGYPEGLFSTDKEVFDAARKVMREQEKVALAALSVPADDLGDPGEDEALQEAAA
jgi:hypothetical protein